MENNDNDNGDRDDSSRNCDHANGSNICNSNSNSNSNSNMNSGNTLAANDDDDNHDDDDHHDTRSSGAPTTGPCGRRDHHRCPRHCVGGGVDDGSNSNAGRRPTELISAGTRVRFLGRWQNTNNGWETGRIVGIEPTTEVLEDAAGGTTITTATAACWAYRIQTDWSFLPRSTSCSCRWSCRGSNSSSRKRQGQQVANDSAIGGATTGTATTNTAVTTTTTFFLDELLVSVPEDHSNDNKDDEGGNAVTVQSLSDEVWTDMVCDDFTENLHNGTVTEIGSTWYGLSDGRKRSFDWTAAIARRIGAVLMMLFHSDNGSSSIRRIHLDRSVMDDGSGTDNKEALTAFVRGIVAAASSTSSLETLCLCQFQEEEDDDEEEAESSQDQSLLGALVEWQTSERSPKELRLEACSIPSSRTVLNKFCRFPHHIHLVGCSDEPLLEFQEIVIRKSLFRNTSLRSVRFDRCGWPMLQVWIEALVGHVSLERVSVTEGGCGAEGMGNGGCDQPLTVLEHYVALTLKRLLEAQALQQFTQPVLQRLDLNVTTVSDVVRREVLACLCCHDVLQCLHLKGSALSHEEAMLIQQMLQDTERLQELQLPAVGAMYDDVEDASWEAIANGLQGNRSLVKLSVNVGVDGAITLRRLVSALVAASSSSSSGAAGGTHSPGHDQQHRLRSLTVASSYDIPPRFLARQVKRLRGLRHLNIRNCTVYNLNSVQDCQRFWNTVSGYLALESFHWNLGRFWPSQRNLNDTVNRLCRVHCRLNWHCPTILRDANDTATAVQTDSSAAAAAVPCSIWPHALASVSPKTSGLYSLLRGYPSMVAERDNHLSAKRRL